MIKVSPTQQAQKVQIISSWSPPGSTTRVWLENGVTGELLTLVKWGDVIYAPVFDGLNLAVRIFNGSDRMRAFPMYVEGMNVWVGGPSEPNACSPDYMWEIKPFQDMTVDTLKNPDGDTGRTLQIVKKASGFGIGENTFATSDLNGTIQIYERSPNEFQSHAQSYRPRGGSESFPGASKGGGFESADTGSYRGAKSLGIDSGPESASRGGDAKSINRGNAAIGAGEEKYVPSHSTGVTYQRNAQLVVALQLEFRSELVAALGDRLGLNAVWAFRAHENQWWKSPYDPYAQFGFGYTPPTAPHIPKAPRRW